MMRTRQMMMNLLLVLLTLTSLGCTAPPPSRDGGFASDNPASLLYAIRRAGEAKDATKVPQLVTALNNDDPAVRMMAIYALKEITGQRLGYDPYSSSAGRVQAIQRWERLVRGEPLIAVPPTTVPKNETAEVDSP